MEMIQRITLSSWSEVTRDTWQTERCWCWREQEQELPLPSPGGRPARGAWGSTWLTVFWWGATQSLSSPGPSVIIIIDQTRPELYCALQLSIVTLFTFSRKFRGRMWFFAWHPIELARLSRRTLQPRPSSLSVATIWSNCQWTECKVGTHLLLFDLLPESCSCWAEQSVEPECGDGVLGQ